MRRASPAAPCTPARGTLASYKWAGAGPGPRRKNCATWASYGRTCDRGHVPCADGRQSPQLDSRLALETLCCGKSAGTLMVRLRLRWAVLAPVVALVASAPLQAQGYFGRNKVQYEQFDWKIQK